MAKTQKRRPAPEPVNETERVDAFMGKLKHPLKAEIEALRVIVMKASPKIGERVKWNGPSFFYKKDMAAINLHRKEFVQVVFVFHDGAMIKDSGGLLEGDYKDRRLARFHDMADVRSKKAALESVVNAWVKLMDRRRRT